MESSEENAHNNYDKYAHIPDLQRLAHEEEVHEQKLISLINEERLEIWDRSYWDLMMRWLSLQVHWQVSHLPW